MKNYLLAIFLCVACPAVLHAQIPQLWGTMQIGGTNGIGTMIKINGDGTGFTKVLSFTDGSPQCNLLPSGNSLLYGMTLSGGTHSLGDIFSYNSTTGVYTILFSLDSTTGYYPHGSLIKATNNKLYGLTSNGGSHDVGVLFSFDPSNNSYSKLHEFDVFTGQYPNGSVVQAANGKLYGTASTGGANGGGLIFSYDISSSTFIVVHDFDFPTGSISFGNLLEASNGLLYGMAFGGGATGYGVIFSLDPNSGDYQSLYNFNLPDGSAPNGSLVQAINGLLYGMTSQGGANSDGTIFSFNLSNNSFNKLHDFDDLTGARPLGSLMQASDGRLYGMTYVGGASDFGAIFSFDITSGTYTKLRDCNITDGGFPYAGLIEYTGLTGIDEPGGAQSFATVYPNPGDGRITVELSNKNQQDVKLSVINALNDKLEERTLSQPATELTLNYPPGVYFIMLRSRGEVMIKKIIIE